MLSARAFNLFREVILKSEVQVTDASYAQELYDIAHPYVVVIHRPSRRGFLLNRRYLHITDLRQVSEPLSYVEIARNHLCATSEMPAWVDACANDEFDSFWLY
jgi:hypothetical protein